MAIVDIVGRGRREAKYANSHSWDQCCISQQGNQLNNEEDEEAESEAVGLDAETDAESKTERYRTTTVMIKNMLYVRSRVTT